MAISPSKFSDTPFPGWLGKISFVERGDSEENVNIEKDQEIIVNEEFRAKKLKSAVQEVRPYCFSKKNYFLDEMPLLDFLKTRKRLIIKRFKLDWKNVSIRFDDVLEKSNLIRVGWHR